MPLLAGQFMVDVDRQPAGLFVQVVPTTCPLGLTECVNAFGQADGRYFNMATCGHYDGLQDYTIHCKEGEPNNAQDPARSG